MKYSDFYAFVSKRGKDKEKRGGIVGQEIKKRRLQLSKTQDEVAEGICCVSYLSKVENNMIAPNASYVSDILRKMDLPDLKTFVTDTYEKYQKALLKDYFMNTDKNSKLILEKANKLDVSYLADLLRFMSYVNMKDIQEADKLIEPLYTLKGSMNEEDLLLYIFYLSAYFILVEKYKKAGEMIVLLDFFEINDVYLKGSIIRLKIIVCYMLHKLSAIHSLYESYMGLCLELGIQSNMLEVRKIYYLSIIESGFSEKFFQMVESDFTFKRDYKMIALGYLYNRDYLLGLKALKAVRNQDSTYYLLKIFLLDRLYNSFEINKLIEEIPQDVLSKMDLTELHLLNMMQKKHKSVNKFEYKVYLRDVAIHFFMEKGDKKCYELCVDELSDVYANDSLYKSVYQLLERRRKNKKEIDDINWKQW